MNGDTMRPWFHPRRLARRLRGENSATVWARFEREIRGRDLKLLAGLPAYPAAVLVGGCQRSGTRLVAALVTKMGRLEGCGDTVDPEAAGAWRLAGKVDTTRPGRFCFQTTYLDEAYLEYLEHENFHLVWVIREPQAVVRSMRHNWYRPGLDRLFAHCGSVELDRLWPDRWRKVDRWRIGALQRACLGYNAKMRQLDVLANRLSAARLSVVDYDDLLAAPGRTLDRLADRCGIVDREHVEPMIEARPSRTTRLALSPAETEAVDAWCRASYQNARRWLGDE